MARYAATSSGSASSSQSASGHAKVMVAEVIAAPLAQVGEAPDGVDQVLVGGELERVHPGIGEARAQRRLAPLGGGGEALAEAGVVRVDEHLLAGLGVLHHHH